MRFLKTVYLICALICANPAFADPLNIVTSFSIIEDFAKNVGGDKITLTTLVKPDEDPHTHEPTPQDARLIKNADLVLINGLHFEGLLELIIETTNPEKIVELTKGVLTIKTKTLHLHNHKNHDHSNEQTGQSDHNPEHKQDTHAHHQDTLKYTDPHAFQSVPNAKIYVKNIADAFCFSDPKNCRDYTQNAQNYIKELDALDHHIRSVVATIPRNKRSVLTSHDAFRYFGKTYGLKFLSLKGVSTESDASAADFARIVRLIRKKKVSALFIESCTDSRFIERIAEETGLKPGGELYADSLSSSNKQANTYIKMMKSNISTLHNAIMKN